MKLQFSTRTLLVVLTMLAVVTFFVLEPRYRRWRQEAAYARLMEQLEPKPGSGLWRFDPSPLVFPMTKLRLSGPGQTGYDRESKTKIDLGEVVSFRELESLSLFRLEVDSLEAVARHRGLKSLSVYACDISDYTSIKNHSSLQFVACDLASFSELPEIDKLQQLQVGELTSSYRVKVPVSLLDSVTVVDFDYDVDAAQLAKFPKLQELHVMQQSVDFYALPRLEALAKIHLVGCYEVRGLAGLRQARNLRELHLQTDELNARQIDELAKLDQLEILKVNASKETVAKLRAALPHCSVN